MTFLNQCAGVDHSCHGYVLSHPQVHGELRYPNDVWSSLGHRPLYFSEGLWVDASVGYDNVSNVGVQSSHIVCNLFRLISDCLCVFSRHFVHNDLYSVIGDVDIGLVSSNPLFEFDLAIVWPKNSCYLLNALLMNGLGNLCFSYLF